MKKIIIILLFILSISDAKNITATYKVSFGIFGRIGVAKAVLQVNKDKTYHISIQAKATGLAKLLSDGRVEKYESSGKIINGFLVPDIYTATTTTHSKIYKKVFIFNHKNKKVKVLKFRIHANNTSKSVETLEYYANNDILTLFFNIKHYLDDFRFTGDKILHAVGANKKDGKVNLIAPTGKNLNDLKRYLGKKAGHFLIVFINQKIFASKRGELYLNLNDDGICTKAVLKDVIFFGDIRGKLINLKETN